jgi:hypothetical protein
MSTIVPKIEKENEEEIKPLERQPTQPTLQEPPVRIEKQQAVIEKGEPGEGKKSRFGRFFSRKDKDKNGRREEEEQEGTNLQKSEKQTDGKESRKQKGGSEEAQTQEKDNVVYLSDEEIEDLLK